MLIVMCLFYIKINSNMMTLNNNKENFDERKTFRLLLMANLVKNKKETRKVRDNTPCQTQSFSLTMLRSE